MSVKRGWPSHTVDVTLRRPDGTTTTVSVRDDGSFVQWLGDSDSE